MLTAKKSVFALAILLVVNLLCSFFPATAFSGGLHRVERLEVVDANGKLVGEVIGIPYYTTSPLLLAFKKEKKLFTVGVYPPFQTFLGYPGGFLFYESTDCSGAPLMYPPDSAWSLLGLPTVVNPPGMTVYVPDTSIIAQLENFNSILGEVAWGWACQPSPGTTFLVPAVPLVDLASVFTPPFSVRGH